jgi:glycosyltransferase involved in cell wall biosynthesis
VGPPSISIIINNFNYGRYLRECIQSALNQTYEAVQVIVVDDGSTDDSRLIISEFDAEIVSVLQANAGQAAAMNAGFLVSNGDLVHFVDSDDFLQPDSAANIAEAWTFECAKIQFRLAVVDANGLVSNTHPAPNEFMPSGDVTHLILADGGYTCPVTTGNVYARQALCRVLPIPEAEFRISADGYLNAAVPFFGSVISIDKTLGAYRVHETNRWAYNRVLKPELLRARIEHATLKDKYIRAFAASTGRAVPGPVSRKSYVHILERLASLRHSHADHPLPDDTLASLVRAGVRAASGSNDGLLDRLPRIGATLAIAFLPRRLSWTVAEIFIGGSRPRWLQRLRALPRDLVKGYT